MKKEERELRMYFLVMYNISPIQQGIQSLHGSKAYVKKYKGNKKIIKLHDEWDQNFETVVILNGGTSNNGFVIDTPFSCHFDETKLGTMELHEKFLVENNIPYASFHEPDLNNALSSLCFICDEKVFDWETYPSFIKWVSGWYKLSPEEKEMKPPYSESEYLTLEYPMWINFVGGEQNAKLKELIYGKKLA